MIQRLMSMASMGFFLAWGRLRQRTIGHRSRLRRLHGRSIPPALRPGRSGVRRGVYR